MNTYKPSEELTERRIDVSISDQILRVMDAQRQVCSYRISTAKNGAGGVMGSGCTPRGRHLIRAKIGGQCKENSIFVGRRPTGEIYSPDLGAKFPGRDWILSRILWLCGCEVGVNRLGSVDTMRRYIYVHGSPDTEPMGVPLSHGCIRMHTTDVVELFGLVAIGTPVVICE